MCVNINKAFDVLCSQSLCEVVVSSCLREVQSKSSFALRVSSCHFGIFCCSWEFIVSYQDCWKVITVARVQIKGVKIKLFL